jgi:hypothetical protein
MHGPVASPGTTEGEPMIKPRSRHKPEIDLSGPDGNAFVLLGRARKWAMQLGLNADTVTTEMRAGDYEHLLQTFDRYFGEYVDLVRNQQESNDD